MDGTAGWRLMMLWGLLALAAASQPCPELHRDLRYPCRCDLTAEQEILVDCDRVVFHGDLPSFPHRAPVVSFRQRWAGHQALPARAFAAAELPLRALDLSHNSLRRLTDRLLLGLQDSLEQLLLGDNLLGDNLNPIFSSSELHGLAGLRELDLSGNLIKGLEEGLLKGCDNLQTLRLDRNSLTSVPSSSLNGPRALRRFSLTENHISAVHNNAFLSQRSLEQIDLSHNRLTVIESGSFAGLDRLRELRLTHNRFSRFNSDVFQGAENLEYLSLSENFISEIPSTALKAFLNLKHLNLSSNLIQSLDGANLVSQPELESLDLSRNNIANIAPGTFLGLRKLKELDISVNALRTVEDDAFEGLDNLESLSLRDNNILLVPASALGRLPRLGRLQMDFNRVAALSGDILRAVAGQVTALSLARNVVRELPAAAFHEFHRLRALDLGGNLLTGLNAAAFVGLERSLRDLRLGQNQLAAVSGDPLALPELRSLDLSGNHLTEVSAGAFTRVPSLAHLNLSGNPQLGAIPSSLLHGVPRLARLDLSHTGLRAFTPDILMHCQALQRVSLRGNAIQEIAENTFKNLRNLTSIDLSYNNIANIRTGAFSGLQNIKRVSLRGNRLSAFKGEYFRFTRGSDGKLGTTLEELDLSLNELSYLFPSSFRVHPRLRRLIVSDNEFSFFPAELIASLQYLEYVDLSGNALKAVEDLDFGRLPRLRTLHLARNQIESLSESAFHNSTQLQILNLGDNKLDRLGERTFEGLARIEMLDLSNNQLSELPDSIFERTKIQMLENINLSGNKFEVAPLKSLQRQYFFLSLVDLSRNNLKDIPPEDSIMVNIKRLDLSFNPLTEEAVNTVLNEPKTVRELNLASTGISKITQLETPFLRHLNLSHNAITELSDRAFERPTLLEVLDVSHNQLSEMTNTLSRVWPRLKNLHHVDISGNSFSTIVQGDFDGLDALQHLKMHDLPKCTKLEKNAFKALGNLVQLTAFGYPRLGYLDVHGILQNLPTLEVLDIEVKDPAVSSDQLAPVLHPRLEEFSIRGERVRSLSSGILAGLKSSSVVIGLRNTSLTTLPPALFFTMPRSSLITLDVSGSKLSTLSPQLLSAFDERRGDLKLVGLASNPLVCDCGARALRRWLPGAGMTGIRCSSPADLAGSLLIEIADDALTCDPNRHALTSATPPPTTVAPPTSPKLMTEPDIIWSLPPASKTSTRAAGANNPASKTPPTVTSAGLNNDDTLIIGIVGGVVAFIAILIIVICIVRLRISNNQYRGGPLASAAALSSGHPSSMIASNACSCVKPPPLYMAGPYATLPAKIMGPASSSAGHRPTYSTMGRQPYYQSPPYFISYPPEEKEHR
ncbi:protein artichoke [Bacillus rossius redtenbacheri]|uniref:protein artichoke n=1 Tax=Bacillus rossius redtenbacheri TaxID=93214 RepID=UPI002FDDF713